MLLPAHCSPRNPVGLPSACTSIHPSVHPIRGIILLALLTGVIGVFVSLGARPPVVFLDVALPAFTAVAAQGVDTDVWTECLVAGGTLVDIWV